MNRVLLPPSAAAFELQQKGGLISCCLNLRKRNLSLSLKPNPMRFFRSGVSDDRELVRNRLMIRCGLKKERKLRKKLEKGLERFAGMGFGIDTKGGLVAEVEANKITEAAEVLLKQLHYLRAAQKESKRKKKFKTKTMLMLDIYGEWLSDSDDVNGSWKDHVLSISGLGVTEAVRQVLEQSLERADEHTSSINSENYKEQCGTADVSELRDVVNNNIILIQWILIWIAAGGVNAGVEAAKISALPKAMNSDTSNNACCNNSLDKHGCRNGNLSAVPERGLRLKKIEVCMSGKCRKSGSPQLLKEFQTLANNKSEGHISVAGCKCLGECKNSPNLRLSATNATPAICSGVEIQDVNTIMNSFLELE